MRKTTEAVPFNVAVSRYRENLGRLTPREKQILGHMLGADSAKQTAFELGMALSTTLNHRSHVLQKLMARNTPELVRIANGAGKLIVIGRKSDEGQDEA